MSEFFEMKFYMNDMAEIVTNEDNEIFVIQKEQKKNFKINEVTAFLLNKLKQNGLNIEQMVSHLNKQFNDIGTIESETVEGIINNFYKNGILTSEAEEKIERKISNKRSRAMLRFELNPTWLDGDVKTNPNFLFNGKKKLISFISVYFFIAIFLYISTLVITSDNLSYSYNTMLFILPIFYVHVLLHEMAHMFACKKLGGDIDKVGVGLLYYFIPVAFVTYKNSYLLSKVSRAKISIAGPLFDLTMLMIVSMVMLLTNSFHHLLFPYSIMVLSMQFFNLNVLMPSDFYRFLESLSGNYNIRKKSFHYLLSVFRLKKSDNYPKVNKLSTKIFYITYSLFSLSYIGTLLGSMVYAIYHII
ncbi:site-2 protease family protein [Virgibacillus sp.]|uniref:site-2 protease family protein n=1 Tax=Virgibacillus sp. TaxID=1872700 RepID=UPI0017B021A3|nr:site-2 protease family protein [Virgibacillus sp.]NWO15016.1 M50 family metallopeptidase [Virgibacillus sp.]